MTSREQIAETIKRTDEMLRQHAATPSALDTLLKNRAAQAAPAIDKMKSSALPKGLPKGISGGRIAAIVACVALAGGALYMATGKKEPKPEMGAWTGRVNSERTASQARQSLDR